MRRSLTKPSHALRRASSSRVERFRQWGSKWGGAQLLLLGLASWTYYDTVIPLNQLTDASEKLVKTERAREAAQVTLDAAKLELEVTRSANAAARAELTAKQSEIDSASAALAAANRAVAVARNDVQRAQSETATSLRVAEQAKSAASSAAASRRSAMSSLYLEVARLAAETVIACATRDLIDSKSSDARYIHVCFKPEDKTGWVPLAVAKDSFAGLDEGYRNFIFIQLRAVSERWVSRVQGELATTSEAAEPGVRREAISRLREDLQTSLGIRAVHY